MRGDATKSHKEDTMRNLKIALQNSENPPTSTFIHLKIPLLEVHNHTIGAGSCFSRPIHPKLKNQIQVMVGQGITNIAFVKRALKQYVLNDLCGEDLQRPHNNDEAYFPSNTTIQNHIHMALVAGRYSALDQENLAKEVAEWKVEDEGNRFFFRKCTNGGDEDLEHQFLFIHQHHKQIRLLQRYGEMVLLDATYKTSKYSMPLFFLVVRTNVGYKPVAEFVCESETTKSIAEALDILKTWNPQWTPKYFMTDYSEQEIQALAQVFPTAVTHLCAFHREQAWLRWTKDGEI